MATTRNIINAEKLGHSLAVRRALRKSLHDIRAEMAESGATCYVGSAEWRSEVGAMIDHLHKEVFYMSEPRDSSPAAHRRVKELRTALHDLYVKQGICG